MGRSLIIRGTILLAVIATRSLRKQRWRWVLMSNALTREHVTPPFPTSWYRVSEFLICMQFPNKIKTQIPLRPILLDRRQLQFLRSPALTTPTSTPIATLTAWLYAQCIRVVLQRFTCRIWGSAVKLGTREVLSDHIFLVKNSRLIQWIL
jgi:hypothetical protein